MALFLKYEGTKFFLKYEGGDQIDLPPLPPQEKLPSKSPALLGLNLSETGSQFICLNSFSPM